MMLYDWVDVGLSCYPIIWTDKCIDSCFYDTQFMYGMCFFFFSVLFSFFFSVFFSACSCTVQAEFLPKIALNAWSKLCIFEQFASTSEIFTQNSLQKLRPKASENFGQKPPKISPKIASKVHKYLSQNAKLTKVSNPKEEIRWNASAPNNPVKKKTRSTTTTTTTTNRRMMTMEARTPILQRFWNKTRINSTNRIVKCFSAVGPTSTRIKRMAFEQVVLYLREQKVIAVSKACLQREPEDSKLKKEFNTIIPRLRSKLQQIAGDLILLRSK